MRSPTSWRRNGSRRTPATPSYGGTSAWTRCPPTPGASPWPPAYTPEATAPPSSAQRWPSPPTLVDELVAADALLFAVPLYNFGVSQHFKTWVDLVITDPRWRPVRARCWPASRSCWSPSAAAATRPAPRGRAGTTPPRLRRILADVWQLDLTVVEREFTLVGVNPALDDFTDLAAELRQQTESDARTHGRSLAERFVRSEQAA